MTRQQVAAVLDTGLALEHALGQITYHGNQHHQCSATERQQQTGSAPALLQTDPKRDQQAGGQTTIEPFPTLARTYPRRQLALAERLAGEVGADIRPHTSTITAMISPLACGHCLSSTSPCQAGNRISRPITNLPGSPPQ